VVAHYLFPALSLIDQNPGLANELWSLVKQFPYDRRYALYGEWKNKTYDSIPELRMAKAGCIRDSKYIMRYIFFVVESTISVLNFGTRRLSKDTTKQFGRYIGKVVHSNPVIAFSIIIDQLQAYDNQIPFVVDASRYLTELSFDVLGYSLLEALAVDKERIQPGGTGVRSWLRALAVFGGNLFKKHTIELSGLLRYLFYQLAAYNTPDLIIIQELIGQMSGLRPVDEATDAQLEALAGGESLRREALMFEAARLTRKPSLRLTRALLDSKMATPIAILIGQHRRETIFREESRELKILGWLFDMVRFRLLITCCIC
jgi:THO complex subunit 2